ncbi:hypothetical protein HDV00_002768 [Rhizophlyctis rosea]|nr:hypothetical protein HDV00_002768 [Rhizophlyctis rosea]
MTVGFSALFTLDEETVEIDISPEDDWEDVTAKIAHELALPEGATVHFTYLHQKKKVPITVKTQRALSKALESGIDEFDVKVHAPEAVAAPVASGAEQVPETHSFVKVSINVPDVHTLPEASQPNEDPNPQFDVMLSYNWANEDVVLALKDALVASGLRVWIDKEQMSRVGNIFDGMIDGITHSTVICPCLSPTYESSQNCRRELMYAVTDAHPQKKVVPVRLHPGPFTWAALITAGSLYVDFSYMRAKGADDWSTLVNRLVENIHEALETVEYHHNATSTTAPAVPTATETVSEVSEDVTFLATILKPVDMIADIDTVSRKRLETTRNWLLDDITNRIQTGTDRVYWLMGVAGVGKSVVAASLFERLDLSKTGAWFFSKHNDSDRNNPERLITTLAYQLASRFPPMAANLAELFRSDPEFITKSSIQVLFRKLVTDPLRSLEDQIATPTIIILDALDEAAAPGSPQREQFLSVFGTELSNLPPTVKFIITSRPEPDIRHHLHDHSPHEFELTSESNKEDLYAFAHFRLSELAQQLPADGALDIEESSRAMCDASQGLFMWIYLACEEVRMAEHPLEVLEQLKAGAMGKTSEGVMDGIYMRALSNAYAGNDVDTSPELFQHVVGAITCMEQSLEVGDLARLIQLDVEIVKRTIRNLAALFTITDQEIQIVHKSFADFVVDADRCTDRRFWIDKQMHRERLAVWCLEMMQRELRRGISGFDDVDIGDVGSLQLGQKGEASISKALSHCCLFWTSYIQGNHTQATVKHVSSILDEHLLHWFEVLSSIGSFNNVLSSLRLLGIWAEEVTSDLDTIISDARRFAEGFQKPIPEHPLNTYYSALAFCPKHTALGQTYRSKPENADTPVVRSGLEATWSPCRRTLEGHTTTVRSVALTPDGKTVVTGSLDNTAKIWDVATGRLITVLEGHTDWVRSVAITPCGSWVATGSRDKSAKVWDAVGSRCLWTFVGHEDWVEAIAISSKGDVVVTGSSDTTAKIWNVEDGSIRTSLVGHSAHVMGVAITHDGKRVVTGSYDHAIKFWNIETGQVLSTIQCEAKVTSVAISADAETLVAGFDNNNAIVRDLKSQRRLHTLSGHNSLVSSVAISPDGSTIVTGSNDRTIRVWDRQTGGHIATLEGHTYYITSVAITDRGVMVSGSHDRTAKIWDLRAAKQQAGSSRADVVGHTDYVSSIAADEEGRVIITGSGDMTAKVWDTRTCKLTQTLVGHMVDILAVTVTSDGKTAVTASYDQTAKVWDTATGSQLASLEPHAGPVCGVAITPDATTVVTEDAGDNTAKVWRREDSGWNVIAQHPQGAFMDIALELGAVSGYAEDLGRDGYLMVDGTRPIWIPSALRGKMIVYGAEQDDCAVFSDRGTVTFISGISSRRSGDRQ